MLMWRTQKGSQRLLNSFRETHFIPPTALSLLICITTCRSLNILSRIKMQATLIQLFNLAREQYLAGKDPTALRWCPSGSRSAQIWPRTQKIETKPRRVSPPLTSSFLKLHAILPLENTHLSAHRQLFLTLAYF